MCSCFAFLFLRAKVHIISERKQILAKIKRILAEIQSIPAKILFHSYSLAAEASFFLFSMYTPRTVRRAWP